MDFETNTASVDRSGADRLLVPGRNCWRIEHADRFAAIVDAADYFASLKSSILKAQRTVFLIGWDFDTRIRLDPDRRKTDGPDKLGRFLNWVVKNRPELNVYVLKWDVEIYESLLRGATPLWILNWMTDRRMHMKLDGAHPVASAHHQKIAVIDDAVAYCGGIDITTDRWDTRDHLDDDPHRRRPTTRRRYDPWHDVTTAVDGGVAAALGELARQRWKRATGEELPPVSPHGDPWPDGVRPTFTDIDVAVARTWPELGDHPEVREIEALYLSAIGAARRSIYMESQYFASRRIAEAMARRLSEPDGPEIVVLNPESSIGWLEGKAMGGARARLLHMIKRADRNRRFRIYTPVTAGGKPIYVHAKIMVVDDWLLRVGSSNLNNRSMGYDTECDLAVEAPAGPRSAEVRQNIVAFRDDLIAEHLGTTKEAVADAIRANSGSLVTAIEALCRPGRTLRPFTPPDLGPVADLVAESDLLDPEGVALNRHSPRRWWRRIRARVLPARLAGQPG